MGKENDLVTTAYHPIVYPLEWWLGFAQNAIKIEANDFSRPHSRHRDTGDGFFAVDLRCTQCSCRIDDTAAYYVATRTARLHNGADRRAQSPNRNRSISHGVFLRNAYGWATLGPKLQ